MIKLIEIGCTLIFKKFIQKIKFIFQTTTYMVLNVRTILLKLTQWQKVIIIILNIEFDNPHELTTYTRPPSVYNRL